MSEERKRQATSVVEPTIFELGVPGHPGHALPALDVPRLEPEDVLPDGFVRPAPPALPEVSEPEVVRHFTRLAELNHHVDRAIYPLGSCTMKYNPKINEEMASLPGFTGLHPGFDDADCQGAIALMVELARHLSEISGLAAVSLQPPAGASGELAGMLMAKAWHTDQGNPRSKVVVPDSAHGTNPASLTLAGYEAVETSSGDDGRIDVDAFRKVVDDETAAVMITNPSTLGIFETRIADIIEIAHERGALVYLDGANLNACMGLVRPGDVGFDIMHFNLHKTFSAPHGGGGPGSGPVGVRSGLEPYLPSPLPSYDPGRPEGRRYFMDRDRPRSIGAVHGYHGNFLVMVKAYAYILANGGVGLRKVSEDAVLNANYLKAKLEGLYDASHEGHCQHEFVLSAERQKEQGARALDIAKRLLDHGIHAPTVYFPLIVPEALMIEPTESESRRSLDAFVEAMISIAGEIEEDPEALAGAPERTPVGRLDESRAARELDVVWEDE
ncbi:MAG: aminotransferase class V-fold PLP-dependent enzyme [Candidatus Eisenbacteria bacterium]|nr:aminotransferase class V-fold PLP-dependent enzyme [Candidatus Eisenbacteria bacterium]